MAKKKQDSSFYNKKAALLREYGIDAQPEKDLVTVGLTFNENHLKSIAEDKGMSAEEFEASIDALAHNEDGAERPGVASVTKEDEPASDSNVKTTGKKAAARKVVKAKKVDVAEPAKDAKETDKKSIEPEGPIS